MSVQSLIEKTSGRQHTADTACALETETAAASQPEKAEASHQSTRYVCYFPLIQESEARLWRASVQNPLSRSSPIAGPCLKPCPEPPPASQTLSKSGCRSRRKSPFEVFSYWQTRDSVNGAFCRAGNRSARKRYASANPEGLTSRSPVSGSKSTPWRSNANLKPRFSRSGSRMDRGGRRSRASTAARRAEAGIALRRREEEHFLPRGEDPLSE